MEFDDSDFSKHAPAMYKLLLKLFDRGMSQELRKALQMFFTRVGDTFLGSDQA